MNLDLRLIVRLLLAILLGSLISTVLMGTQMHRRIMESMVNKINQKVTRFETEIPKRQLPLTLSQNELDIFKTQRNVNFRLPHQTAVKDWHDHVVIKADKSRIGLGEQGRPAEIPNTNEKEETVELYEIHGFNAQLSDHISLSRSLPDIRPLSCWNRKYLERLPNVTVIIAFHNEHLSVLLRSITSIINRSPPELLKQVVLVDDGSNFSDLGQKLDDFVTINFPSIVEILRLTERRGLIKARMEAAKIASCQVLVFLDSHIEVNNNWLPPLLEPIVINRSIVTGPILDIIWHKTFAYTKYNSLTRSGFNWWLQIQRLPVFPEDQGFGSTPYRTALLVGVMAIDRDYFWNLGGYDEELDIWGGEQFEMSFKVWMCGGMMLYVPCSRVGHINRGPMSPKPNPRSYNFLATNYKRVAEVWMDEYRKYVYDRNPELYEKIQVGLLSGRKSLRRALQCKSFAWYMDAVAQDFLNKFPTVDVNPMAVISGPIESVAYPGFCVDSLDRKHKRPVVLSRCMGNRTKSGEYQQWHLTKDQEIRLMDGGDCLETQGIKSKSVWLFHCHENGGNQYWFYNRRHRWIQQGQMWIWCLEAHLPNGQEVGKVLSNNACHKNNPKQQWKFGEIAVHDPQTQYRGA
ncbi:putative polypeptide N-acetylgalactosaminyltransferase 10 [Drosophila rhopaloa]|uniref:Polypeptide N-acetylgalactosaminyltransferase n=1 Tax=Drosophila rhopaloa TaxID=1041015 RepID=A0A6P4EX53_DRORH|nr:putative polypeptide N-acetylgalactosaminyltransferase 10 [Drosophila rhopaloa]